MVWSESSSTPVSVYYICQVSDIMQRTLYLLSNWIPKSYEIGLSLPLYLRKLRLRKVVIHSRLQARKWESQNKHKYLRSELLISKLYCLTAIPQPQTLAHHHSWLHLKETFLYTRQTTSFSWYLLNTNPDPDQIPSSGPVCLRQLGCSKKDSQRTECIQLLNLPRAVTAHGIQASAAQCDGLSSSGQPAVVAEGGYSCPRGSS